MRPVTTTDLVAAARVLLAVSPPQRPAAMRALIIRADLADRHRSKTGRQHPIYGNGTLLAAALVHPARSADALGETAYLACLACSIDSVLAWRGRADP